MSGSLELMVPVSVHALWVAHLQRVIGPLADHERLPWFDGTRDRNGSVPHLAAAINAAPFSDHNAWLEPGVHLHWFLPAGLTRGGTRRTAERTVQVGDLWFPPAPNRWLVFRREERSAHASRAWLVESDYVHPPGLRPRGAIAYPLPYPQPGQAPFVYLGRQIRLDPLTLEPEDPAVQPASADNSLSRFAPALTAVGPGDPLFAAHYPSCRSVFGLHDDQPAMDQVAGYSVYGWYGDGLIEPLHNLRAALRDNADHGPARARHLLARQRHAEQLEALEAHGHGDHHPLPPEPVAPEGPLDEAQWNQALRLALRERFGWTMRNDTDTAAFPTDLMCAGMTAITAGLEHVPDQPPTTQAAGIGHNPAEAAVAFVTAGVSSTLTPDIEDRLTQELTDTDLSDHALDFGPKRAEARHREQFRSERGHAIWTVRTVGSPDPEQVGARSSLPDGLAHELNELNLRQAAYDRAQDQIAALRQELFSDWSRYMTAAYPEGDADPFGADVDAVRDLAERSRLEPLEALLRRSGRLFHAHGADGGVSLADAHTAAFGHPRQHGRLAGGPDGLRFDDAVAPGERLLGFDVYFGSIIDGLTLVGSEGTRPRRTLSGQLARVRLAAGEHITAIFGEAGVFMSMELVSKLGFETSHGRRLGPWGWNPEPLPAFRLEAPPGTVVVGLCGRSATWLSAVGILVAPPGHHDLEPEPAGETLAGRVVEQHRRVQAVLADAEPARTLQGHRRVLATTPGPRFWRPNDPVIALSDSHVQANATRGGAGPDGKLSDPACFLIAVTGGWGAAGKVLAGNLRAPLSASSGRWTLAEHPLFMSGSQAKHWWPLQLEWEVELRPVADGGNTGDEPAASDDESTDAGRSGASPEGRRYAADFITRSQALRVGAVDWVPRQSPKLARSYQYLAGRSLLNPSIGARMVDQLKRLPDELKPHVAVPESLMLLPLSGFHDHLLMQGQEPQLPISDPIGLPGQRSFTERVRQAVGPLHPTTPLFDSPFHPIRSGELLIERLRVMDAFGRTQVWKPSKLHTPRALRADGDARDRAAMSLRLAQSARLDLRWLSGAHGDLESNAHPSTSPVCGWLVVNELDDEIDVYAGSGHLLGSVDQAGTWSAAPGDTPSPRHWRDVTDSGLRRLLHWLTLPVDGRVAGFIAHLDEVLATIDPKDSAQHAARALLIGRPVAVARARLALTLRHPAAIDQSVTALNARLAGDVDQTHGVGDVRVPVRLGGRHQVDDGLCAWWIEDGALFRDEGTGPHLDELIELTPDGPPRELTLLLDPRGAVHATCGLLPAKSIDIPPDLFKQQVADLRITFRTQPVICDPDDVALPLPSEPGALWSWIERRADGWTEVPHHPTVRRDDLVHGFGARGDALWQKLVALGRIRLDGHDDQGVLMPMPDASAQPTAPTPSGAGIAAAPDPFAELGLDTQAVERGLHDVARALGEADVRARYDARAVAREGWLQLRAEPLPQVRKAGGGS